MNVNNLSEHLQNLISSDSELGSRLLSLLLVSSGNAEELISMINNGQDVSQFKKLREPRKEGCRNNSSCCKRRGSSREHF